MKIKTIKHRKAWNYTEKNHIQNHFQLKFDSSSIRTFVLLNAIVFQICLDAISN